MGQINMSSPLIERQRALDALLQGVDVLVIGGGITGAGVALDAATRGYRVAVVEQADFASGTSSRSTKLLHGGLRYVPQFQIRLVREALEERDRLRQHAPHLVRPLPFVVPVYEGMQRPLGLRVPAPLRSLAPLGIRVGLVGYDLLARSDLPHRRLTSDEALQHVPALRTTGLRAAYLYYDAQTDDVRLTHAVLATARCYGAITLNYVRAEAVAVGPGFNVALRDRLMEQEMHVQARHVVNATGVWAEEVAAFAGWVPFRIQRSKGVHLILDCLDLVTDAALVIPETDDGRLAFLLPWRGRLILGTTDDPYEGDPARPRTAPGEARYLLNHMNRYFKSPVGPQVVIGAYAGLRPLVRWSSARPADLSRDHEVVQHDGGLVSIIGGKLTTYRKMAEDVIDVLARRDGLRTPCRTKELVLDGGEDPETVHAQVLSEAATLGLPHATAEYVYQAYGSRAILLIDMLHAESALRRPLVPGRPEISAEVVLACREEQAVTLADWLILRSRLALLDRNHARECAEEVGRLMARELGWTVAEQARQLATFDAMMNEELAFLRGL